MVLYVNGNVIIEENVEEIDAVIYATGKIDIRDNGNRTDKKIIIRGGLYGNIVGLGRDRYKIDGNTSESEEIRYKEIYVASGKDNAPKGIQEVKIYWKELY